MVAVADAAKALADAKNNYSQAQRDYAAGKITKEALDDSKVNIALATANVATAQIAVGAAAAGAAASTVTYGFTIGANGERIETTSTTNTEQSQWQGSNLDLSNLKLKAEGQDVNIQGSRVNATGTTVFDGTKDLNVTAGVERSKQDSSSKTDSQSVSYTYGGGSASIGKQTSQSKSESLTHVNSEVELNRTEGAIEQLNIKGGTVSIADRGNLKVNGIHVESLQNTASSSNSSKGGSIGGGYGSGSKNITASYSQGKGKGKGKGNSDSAWVNETSKLLIGNAQNNADLDAMGVKKVANVGGVLANATKNTDGTLTDHGKLNYSGELELKDIEDHNYNSSRGFNVSTTIGIPQKGTQESFTAPKGSTTIGLNSNGQETEQLTKATMGQGTVKNATDSTNRDINNTQEITRDQTTGMLDGSVTIDHRLLTEDGRKEIIQEQKDLPENFRQSAENLAQALPDGEYKDKVLKTLNNIQASLVKMPEEMRAGGETLADNYAEYIKKGGEPKDFELMMNDPDILAGIKAVNDLNTIKNQAIVTLMSQGLSQEQANNLVNQSESGAIDENGIRSFILKRIKVQASAGIIVPNAKDEQAKFGQEQLDIDKTSNIVIDAVTQMGQIKQKVDQRIANSNINPEYVGLALSLVLGGPANLVKSEVIDRIFGDEIAKITDRLKTEGTAYLLNTDAETVETTLANKNLINQSGNETAKQLVDQLEWTKDGVGVVSGVILGGVGGSAVGKSNTTKIDGKEVEVSTAGVSRGELTKPYEPNQTRKDLEAVYGKDNVKSTTVPSKPHQARSTRNDVIIDVNGGKAVQIKLEDGSTKMIPYDSRGLAIFDDVVVFTTKIDDSKSYSGQMSQASKDMWNVIKDDRIAQSKFTINQLEQLRLGEPKVEGYTWHHNAQSSPNSMQLVPNKFHSNKAVPHTGQNSLKDGK